MSSSIIGTSILTLPLSIDASKITTGTLATTVVPDLDASKITTGTLDTARIPDLSGSKITTGTVLGTLVTQASTSTRGTVQLSSATNSTSTSLAATSSAVKSAYDLAASKVSVSTNSGTNDTNFNVGHVIAARIESGTLNRNTSRAMYLANSVDRYTDQSDEGSALLGTWRSSGRSTLDSFNILRRIS